MQPWEYGRLNTVERVLLAQRIAGEPDEHGAAPQRHAAACCRRTSTANFSCSTSASMPADSSSDDVMSPSSRDESPRQVKDREGPGRRGDTTSRDPDRHAPQGHRSAAGRQRCRASGGPATSDGAMAGQGGMPHGEALSCRDGRGGKKHGRCRPKDKEPRRLFFADEPRSASRSASSTASSTRRRSGPRTTTTSSCISKQTADLVPVAPFWHDYARHDGKIAVPLAEPSPRRRATSPR